MILHSPSSLGPHSIQSVELKHANGELRAGYGGSIYWEIKALYMPALSRKDWRESGAKGEKEGRKLNATSQQPGRNWLGNQRELDYNELM